MTNEPLTPSAEQRVEEIRAREPTAHTMTDACRIYMDSDGIHCAVHGAKFGEPLIARPTSPSPADTPLMRKIREYLGQEWIERLPVEIRPPLILQHAEALELAPLDQIERGHYSWLRQVCEGQEIKVKEADVRLAEVIRENQAFRTQLIAAGLTPDAPTT